MKRESEIVTERDRETELERKKECRGRERERERKLEHKILTGNMRISQVELIYVLNPLLPELRKKYLIFFSM